MVDRPLAPHEDVGAAVAGDPDAFAMMRVDLLREVRVLVEKVQQHVAEPFVGARTFQHDRQVVGHRDLDRQTPRKSLRRDFVRVHRRGERVDEHLRREERSAQPRDQAGQRRGERRRQEEQRGVHAHEVPIARRSSAAAPRVGEKHEEADRRSDDREENEQAPQLGPLAREQPEQDRDDAGKEVRNESEVPADQEVLDVVSEAVREIAQHAVGVGVVRAHLLTARRPGVVCAAVERKTADERLAVAALVVELARIERGHAEEDGRRHDAHGAGGEAAQVLAPPPRPQHDRRDQQPVARLGIGGDSEENCGENVGRFGSE